MYFYHPTSAFEPLWTITRMSNDVGWLLCKLLATMDMAFSRPMTGAGGQLTGCNKTVQIVT